MIYFLFLILLGASSYLYLNNKKKINFFKKQLYLCTRQKNSLKEKLNIKNSDKLNIVFEKPEYNKGIIIKESNLYLLPLENSPILIHLNKNEEVNIKYHSSINNEFWYYGNVGNYYGWIEQSFLFLTNTSEKDSQNNT